MANGRTASHMVPWKGGKPLAWDVTAVRTMADSYVAATAREAAQQRNVRLSSKSPNILVWRISVSSSQLQWSRFGPLNETACQFLKDLGRRISTQSGDERESAFLFLLPVVIQRFNAILLDPQQF